MGDRLKCEVEGREGLAHKLVAEGRVECTSMRGGCVKGPECVVGHGQCHMAVAYVNRKGGGQKVLNSAPAKAGHVRVVRAATVYSESQTQSRESERHSGQTFSQRTSRPSSGMVTVERGTGSGLGTMGQPLSELS